MANPEILISTFQDCLIVDCLKCLYIDVRCFFPFPFFNEVSEDRRFDCLKERENADVCKFSHFCGA